MVVAAGQKDWPPGGSWLQRWYVYVGSRYIQCYSSTGNGNGSGSSSGDNGTGNGSGSGSSSGGNSCAPLGVALASLGLLYRRVRVRLWH